MTKKPASASPTAQVLRQSDGPDRSAGSLIRFFERLFHTAVLLGVRPRVACGKILDRVEGNPVELVDDRVFLFIASFAAGIYLRLPVAVDNSRAFIRDVIRNAAGTTIVSALVASLPLLFLSLVAAKLIAWGAAKGAHDRQFIEALQRYVFGEFLLVLVALYVITGAITGTAIGAVVRRGLPSTISYGEFKVAVFVVGFGAFVRFLIPVIGALTVSGRCLALGRVENSTPGSLGKAVPFMVTSSVAMTALLLVAQAIYRHRDDAVDTGGGDTLVIEPRAATLAETDRLCAECPLLVIPIMIVNRGRAPARLDAVSVQIQGPAASTPDCGMGVAGQVLYRHGRDDGEARCPEAAPGRS